MAHNEREHLILEYLQKNGEATVEELCRATCVSEPTMRRDLAALNNAGKILRTHGGAVHKHMLGENLPQSYREREHSAAKLEIGKKCLSLIKEDDIIMQVTDNGICMTEQQCKEILQKDIHNKGGIGIKNVNDRVKIYFGEKYGVSIFSELDEGTRVEVRMPKILEESYEM